jgi:hypothetical protein
LTGAGSAAGLECERVLGKADYSAKKQIIEVLDLRGKLAPDGGEKAVYLKCLIDLLEQ